MSFLKKLFSSGKKEEESKSEPDFKGVYREDAFQKRYKEETFDSNSTLIDGCLKMVESYFLENPSIKKKIEKPINHPFNLDQTVNEGPGFLDYCKRFNFGDKESIMFLAYAFSEFLVTKYGFKLYQDSEPEFPLRAMTLKYNNKGVVLSLYPFEYALKVLNKESAFESLFTKIDSAVGKLPTADELLNKLTDAK